MSIEDKIILTVMLVLFMLYFLMPVRVRNHEFSLSRRNLDLFQAILIIFAGITPAVAIWLIWS